MSDSQAVTETQPLLDSSKPKAHYNLVGLSQSSFWVLCFTIWTCSFLAAFDGSVVATLLGPISSSFLKSNLSAWLGTSYLLSVCCFTPIYGRLANIIGRRNTMIVSLCIFGIGNALCAAAPSMETLIAARAFAGIGGGGLQTLSSIITSDIVPLTYRGIYQGLANIIFGAGVALGPTLGGIINDSFGWRWAFWIQIPIFIVCIFLAHRFIRYTSPSLNTTDFTAIEILRRLDLFGCFLLAGWIGTALIAVSLVTNSTSDYPSWSSPIVVALFVFAGVDFLFFLVWELKIVAFPVIPFELLHRRTPIAVAINNLVMSLTAFAQLYTVPLFFLSVRLMSPSDAGRHLIPNPVTGTIAALGGGLIVRRTGRYYWLNVFGAIIFAIANVLLALWSTNVAEWRLWFDFPLVYFGGSLMSTMTILALIGDVGREGIAAGTSLSYTARMTGQVLGVGVAGAILQAVLSKQLNQRITGPGADEIIATVRESSLSVQTLPEPYKSAAVASYQQAIQAVFIFCAAIGVLALLSALCVKEVDTTTGAPAKPAATEEDAATSDSEE